VKLRLFPALPLAAGLTGVLVSGVVGAALAPLTPLPAHSQQGKGNGKGPNQGGNNGNGPNPSRGNAGRNSGATTVSNSVMVPTVRFAPSGLNR
jgi:hypothetical protein